MFKPHRKKITAILVLSLIVGAVIFLHTVPIKQYSYLLSTVCRPNLLPNNGADYKTTESYRVILGQQTHYDEAITETQKLRIPQNTQLQDGCEYSYVHFRLYVL